MQTQNMPEALLKKPRRSKAPVQPEGARASLTPASWIECALVTLVDGGIDLVRVDVLAKQLEVTRGSFYWHFKDRNDLLVQMLNSWRDAKTEQIIDRFDSKRGEPKALIQELLSLPFRGKSAHNAARVELAIRDWARRDPMARHAVDDVDSRRISYISQCFSALGFDIAEARSRAFLLYALDVAESLLLNQGSPAQKVVRSRLAERLLLTPVKANK
jgi:AcrR family transcriptional regulator